MSSVSATSVAAPPATSGAGNAIDPRLEAVVKQMPADQQAAALAKLKALTPAQQQQLIAQVEQSAAAQAGTGTGTGTAPAADQAAAGAAAVEPPNKMGTILKKVALFGGIGAALGFGASMLGLPFIGGLSAPILAAIGGGIGAVIGFVAGNKEASAPPATPPAETPPATTPPAAETPPPAEEPAPAPAPAPEAEPAVSPRAGGARYTVVKGDCLSTIAAKHGMTWQELYAANKDAVGSNPHLIHPGLKLKIPHLD